MANYGLFVPESIRTIVCNGGDNNTPVFFGWRLSAGTYISGVRGVYTPNVSTVTASIVRFALGNSEPTTEAQFEALTIQLTNDQAGGFYTFGETYFDHAVEQFARENRCLVGMVASSATDSFVAASLYTDPRMRLTRKQLLAIG